MFRRKNKKIVISHGPKHRSWRVIFTWFRYVTALGSKGTGVPDFGTKKLVSVVFPFPRFPFPFVYFRYIVFHSPALFVSLVY